MPYPALLPRALESSLLARLPLALFLTALLTAIVLVLAPPLGAQTRDLPWEISTPQGEVVLPNIFYAEAVENEQIMPLAIDAERVQIDRLIYPTLGNPNLFDRAEAGDELLVVLRLEEALYAHLDADERQADPGGNPELRLLQLEGGDAGRLAFHLVDRHRGGEDGRAATIEITPTRLLIHRLRGVPEIFRHRRTVRAVFTAEALAEVPEGLYDVRFEITRDGAVVASERQMNAVRLFDRGTNEAGEYTVLNVTDSQSSLGDSFRGKTLDKLRDFVSYVNTSDDPDVRSAAFITFNGDLHNGGAPEWVLSEMVATTYNEEARAILAVLQKLTKPIFLTVGNHDGYVSMGHVPGFVQVTEKLPGKKSLEEVIEAASPKAWPGFTLEAYRRYIEATAEQPGGRHVDIFVGRHARRTSQSFKSWEEIPEKERNLVLYDGFHQWRRTYGPLYSSFSFGRNYYINLNSYELRQHRRSGWGMYTVNYGGGLSNVQLLWLNRALGRADRLGKDVIVLAHHDPRGGHKGEDFPYYFRQVDYTGIGLSAKNYVEGEVLNPILCKKLPEWAQDRDRVLGCLHDGLQEWMRPDAEFDCADWDRLKSGKDAGKCNIALFKPGPDNTMKKHPYYSGYAVIDQLANRQSVRTLLLGHTHYNSLQVLLSGDEIVPGTVVLDAASHKRYASLEVENPLRGFSALWNRFKDQAPAERVYDPKTLERNGFDKENELFVLRLEKAGHSFERAVQGEGRELAILRLTTVADLTTQKRGTTPNFGFSAFKITRNEERYALPQINEVVFFQNNAAAGSTGFNRIGSLVLDRGQRDDVGGAPLSKFFTGF